MDAQLVTTFIALAMFAGCATYDNEDSAHYRKVHNNTPVFVTVTDDLDRTHQGVRRARNEMGAGTFDATVDIDNFARIVRQTMQDYGIVVVDSETEARRFLAISIDVAGPTGLGGHIVFGATATYTQAGESRSLKIYPLPEFDRLAQTAVESALLVWHPSEPARDVDSPWGRFNSASHTLFPTSPIGGKNEVPFGEPLVLTWESFPSDRILAGSGISPDRISGVSYELQVGLWGSTNPFSSITLKSAFFDLDDKIPWCGRIRWTLRARFMLDDHPRVTAWSPLSMTRIGAPHGVECYSINWAGALKPRFGFC